MGPQGALDHGDVLEIRGKSALPEHSLHFGKIASGALQPEDNLALVLESQDDLFLQALPHVQDIQWNRLPAELESGGQFHI
jgi:hypothetical protein